MESENYKQFKSLYTQFIRGSERLNKLMAASVDVTREKKEFITSVIEPMDVAWLTLTGDEKAYWLKVDDAIKVLKRGGQIKT